MNMFGRKHIYPDHSEIYMKNFNRLIQSSASDMVLLSAYRLQQTGWIQPLLLVHDEIVSEFDEIRKDEAAALIPQVMTNYVLPTHRGNIPLKVEGHINSFWEKE
jgi:DNA polymerase I-like protein with 3'-5' exonuclease and polymerase domains